MPRSRRPSTPPRAWGVPGAARGTRVTARPGRRGITLFAILVSLCAIAVLAVIAIPAFFGDPDVTLNNACKLIVRDLRSAQNRATYLGSGAVFRVHADGWEATRPDGSPLGRRAGEAIVRSFSRDGVFEGVRIERVELGGDDRLAFDERGLALEGGSLEIVYAGERRRVSIEAGSGLAHATDESGALVAGEAIEPTLPNR